MKTKPKITFANFGNYSEIFKALFEDLGLEVLPPEKTHPKTITEGANIAPEMYCFPLKVNLGNYLSAIKNGANTIFMATALGGSCRLRYYGVVQEKVLEEAGYNVRFIIFDQKINDIYSKIKEISGASFFRILKAFYYFWRKLNLIETLEKKAQHLRPREIEKGAADQLFAESITKIGNLKKEGDFSKLKKEILEKFSQIEIKEKKDLPRVGLIGEIYTVCDPAINFWVEKKLGEAGIEVHREMNLSYHLKKKIFFKDFFIQKKIKPYLGSTVGGHGRDAIYEMLHYIKENFDGIIHLLPFQCFVKDTNITVDGYLQKPIQDIRIGEKVLTHKGRFKKVTHKFCRNYQGPILKIDCGGKLLTISVTPEHPILLAKATRWPCNRTKEIKPLKFIPAYQAKKGDFVAIPIPKDIDDPVSIDYSTVETIQPDTRLHPNFKKIDTFVFKPDLLKLLGYYLAEGCITYYQSKQDKKVKIPHAITFGFNINEKKYVEDLLRIISANFKNLRIAVKDIAESHKTIVVINSKSLGEYISYLCGSRADKKRFSSELLNLEPALQKEILKGFFRGDGSFRDEYGETTYRGVTTSRSLASQLFWLLVRNRIKPSFLEQHIKDRKLSYMLKIATAHEIKRLGEDLIKVTDRKKFIKHREIKDYFLVPIRKMEWANFKGRIYNLTVEDDHSYIANFLSFSNCMPEVTVRPILEKIHQESGIPFLSISLDEQVAEAGIDTRLEAFTDVVRDYHN